MSNTATTTHANHGNGKEEADEQQRALKLREDRDSMLTRSLGTCGFASFCYFFDYYFAINATFAMQAFLSQGDTAVAASYASLISSLTSALGVVVTPQIGAAC